MSYYNTEMYRFAIQNVIRYMCAFPSSNPTAYTNALANPATIFQKTWPKQMPLSQTHHKVSTRRNINAHDSLSILLSRKQLSPIRCRPSNPSPTHIGTYKPRTTCLPWSVPEGHDHILMIIESAVQGTVEEVEVFDDRWGCVTSKRLFSILYNTCTKDPYPVVFLRPTVRIGALTHTPRVHTGWSKFSVIGSFQVLVSHIRTVLSKDPVADKNLGLKWDGFQCSHTYQ